LKASAQENVMFLAKTVHYVPKNRVRNRGRITHFFVQIHKWKKQEIKQSIKKLNIS